MDSTTEQKSMPEGLSAAQVAERVSAGAVNVDADVKTRTVKRIFYDNICTLFNAVNVILAAFVAITGSWRNMLFMIVIICNTTIGIVQEIRSKRVTDRLSIVASSKAEVVRDGALVELPINELVRDDVIRLGRGDQVPADAEIVDGRCEVNESLLTGESTLIEKGQGDSLMSGSFVNSGTVWARIVHVGAENYAAKITEEAKRYKKVNSEIMNSLNGIIRVVSFVIFPLGALLFCRQYFLEGLDFNDTILSTVAALVGMIPEGLILLTSIVLAVAVIRLSASNVLVQQLYCIETLARVDTLCLDKTGTITTGAMEVSGIHPLKGVDDAQIVAALAAIEAGDDDPNETARAIQAYLAKQATPPTPKVRRVVPFSSDKKYSGAVLDDGCAYVMGAGRFILGDAYDAIAAEAEKLAANDRVILVVSVDGFTDDNALAGKPTPLGFVTIRDEIRSTAAQTIAYFKEQGVTLNVISGDDPATVAHIAGEVGVPGADKYVDASTLDTPEAVADAIAHYHIFGRVKPEQKKEFVCALQDAGHIVAMTGDGVNDTLALKQSDCSVAMASGSDAARNVAQLVLVDNDFASMPKVVAEGRRAINNLQRSASLFLVKTLFSSALALLFVFLAWRYPFEPIQMTLISAFTIGLPSFVLALEPNHDRIKGRFLENVIVRSIPGAICVVAMIVTVNAVSYMALGLSYEQTSTLCVLLTSWTGFMLIIRLSWPFTALRIALLIVVVGGTVGACLILPWLFSIASLTQPMIWELCIGAAAIALIFNILFTAFDRWHAARQAKIV